MNLIEYPDSDMMMIDLANKIAGELTNCLFEHDRASLAVPGGSTPGPMFDALSGADLDWSRVDVFLTDERQVPADHARSNERLLRERLLRSRAAVAEFQRFVPQSDADWPEIHARATSHLPISVLLLGMGADMHTASLFPGSPDLPAALAGDAPPLMAVKASGDLEDRITLTGPALQNAMSTHVLIKGEDKREALDRALHLHPSEAPISLVLGQASVHWAP